MRFIEVCAGAGGMSTGFIEAGFTCIAACDLNKTCCETLRRNHAGLQVECISMKDFDVSAHTGACDVLIGGIPCQSFSYAGKRKGTEDERNGSAVFDFVRILRHLNPKAFVVENVAGMLTHADFPTILNTLAVDDVYQLSHCVLSAEKYGVPQKRRRLFIVGLRKPASPFFFPLQTVEASATCGQAFADIPPGDDAGFKYAEEKRAVLSYVPQGGCWKSLPLEMQKSYMGAALKSLGGRTGFARRLSLNEPSPTVTTSPCQKSTEMCHPIETRPLTVRECARLQTFPDSYKFCGTVAEQYRQVGNAVPVVLAKAVAAKLLAHLNQQ